MHRFSSVFHELFDVLAKLFKYKAVVPGGQNQRELKCPVYIAKKTKWLAKSRKNLVCGLACTHTTTATTAAAAGTATTAAAGAAAITKIAAATATTTNTKTKKKKKRNQMLTLRKKEI